MGGLFPIVSSARVLAIRHNIPRRATPDRDLHAGISPTNRIEPPAPPEDVVLLTEIRDLLKK